jgi:hypothetical protein
MEVVNFLAETPKTKDSMPTAPSKPATKLRIRDATNPGRGRILFVDPVKPVKPTKKYPWREAAGSSDRAQGHAQR